MLSIIHLTASSRCGMAVRTRSRTFARFQRTKRLSELVCGPWHSSRPCHGVREFNTRKMPLRTRLSSTRGTPRNLQGRIGAIDRQRVSERASLMFKAAFGSLNHTGTPNFNVCLGPDTTIWSLRSTDRLEPILPGAVVALRSAFVSTVPSRIVQ